MERKDYDNGNEGGFINPKHTKSRIQKIKWDAANDRKLLLLAMGREMSPKEWPIIAAMFKEKPTAKAVQERYTKLRSEQRVKLRELGILDDDKLAKIHDVRKEDLVDDDDEDDDDPDTITVATNMAKTASASDDLSYTPVDNSNKGKKKKSTPGKPPAKKGRRSTVIDDDDDTIVTPLAPETEQESRDRRVAEARKGYYGA